MFDTRWAKLLVLTAVHFSVDFCGGLTIPLPEPTLTGHLGVSLREVALLLGCFGLLVNAIQPLAGWLFPKRGLPVLLGLAPLAAAMIPLLGLTSSYWVIAGMLLIAALGIGIAHPEGALAAHALSGGRQGLGVSIFMSGGYFGFSLGSLVSGLWVEHYGGLTRFWLLALPAVVVAIMVFAAKIHRMPGHLDDGAEAQDGRLPAWLTLALCACVAVNMAMLVRFIPILLVRRFPGQGGQGWGGATVFATGITGALGAFLWGHLSDGRRRGYFVAAAQLLAAPFLYLLVRTPSIRLTPVWGLGIGLTMGAVFPLTVVLARQARGKSLRLRLGFAIGGAWGLGEVAFIVGGNYIGHFPGGIVEPVLTVLSFCWVLLALTAVAAIALARREQPQEAPT